MRRSAGTPAGLEIMQQRIFAPLAQSNRTNENRPNPSIQAHSRQYQKIKLPSSGSFAIFTANPPRLFSHYGSLTCPLVVSLCGVRSPQPKSASNGLTYRYSAG
jgi:hypothetical protein